MLLLSASPGCLSWWLIGKSRTKTKFKMCVSGLKTAVQELRCRPVRWQRLTNHPDIFSSFHWSFVPRPPLAELSAISKVSGVLSHRHSAALSDSFQGSTLRIARWTRASKMPPRPVNLATHFPNQPISRKKIIKSFVSVAHDGST